MQAIVPFSVLQERLVVEVGLKSGAALKVDLSDLRMDRAWWNSREFCQAVSGLLSRGNGAVTHTGSELSPSPLKNLQELGQGILGWDRMCYSPRDLGGTQSSRKSFFMSLGRPCCISDL